MKQLLFSLLLCAFSTVTFAQFKVTCSWVKKADGKDASVIYSSVTQTKEDGNEYWVAGGYSSTSKRSLKLALRNKAKRPTGKYSNEFFAAEKESLVPLSRYFKENPEAYGEYVKQRNKMVASVSTRVLK